mgnify:CR=1 FL=1
MEACPCNSYDILIIYSIVPDLNIVSSLKQSSVNEINFDGVLSEEKLYVQPTCSEDKFEMACSYLNAKSAFTLY